MFSLHAIAAGTVKIKGKVIDADNRPVEFATVRINKSTIGTITNLRGEYDLSVASSDSLVVIFNCLGYKESSRTLHNPEGTVQLDVRLYTAINKLDEVVVTENRRQTSTVQKLEASQAKLVPSASGSGVEAMLTTIAGVNSNNELSSQYSVRGGNFDENIVYVNGIEVYRPQLVSSGEQEGLSFINPDMVGEIAFSTGGFSAEYGDKMSSVLDITYKMPEVFEGAVSASFLGASATVGQRTERFSQLHGFRYKTNSSLLSSLDTQGEYNPNFFDYQTYLTYQFSDKLRASFLGNISSNNYNFTPEERTTSFGTLDTATQFTVYFDGQESDASQSVFGSLNLTYDATERSTFSIVSGIYCSQESVNYDITGQYWLDEIDTSGSGDQEVEGALGVGTYHEHARNELNTTVASVGINGATQLDNHLIKWGTTIQQESIKDKVNEWEMRDSAGYSLPYEEDAISLVYSMYSNQDITSTRFSAFVQDSYRCSTDVGLFTVNGGVRLAYWSFNDEWLVSPRFSVGYIPEANDKFTFRLAGGVYYQTPFYKEYRDTIRDSNNNLTVELNSDIKSQRSIQVVAGGDYSFRAVDRPFKLTTELYYKDLSNIIPYEVDNLSIWYAGENLATGYTAGLDMKLYGEFVPGTDSWISFSLMSSKETFYGVTVPRPNEQRYSFALFFQDYVPNFPKYKFHLRAIWADGVPVGSPSMGRTEYYFRTPAYRRVDIGASRLLVGGEDMIMQSRFLNFFKSIWIGIDVFNLLDINNVSSYYWVTDITGNQYAVPNYLTSRQLNIRISAEF